MGCVVLALFASGCGATSKDVSLAAASSTTTVPLRSETSVSSHADEAASVGDEFESIEVGPVRGLISGTGVPVSVLGSAGSQMVVRTPCGALDFVSGGTQLRNVEVVVDPGHGGPISTGAVGPNGLVESDLNLRVTGAVLAELDNRGIIAASTRSANYATTLEVRSAFADNLGARLMVSIHHNAPNGALSDSPGTEVYVQSGSADSSRLGGLLQAYVSDALDGFDDVRWTAAVDAGVMRVLNSRGTDAYGMIRRPATTTALLELGYISNRAEAELFATSEYVQVAGTAVADAVEAFLTSSEPGSGFVGLPRIFNPQSAPDAHVCEDPALG